MTTQTYFCYHEDNEGKNRPINFMEVFNKKLAKNNTKNTLNNRKPFRLFMCFMVKIKSFKLEIQ